MITVREIWQLKAQFAGSAREIMQEMDDLAGPGAHGDPGWVGHAVFLQNSDRPTEIIVQYPWANRESHSSLVSREQEILPEFTEKYCSEERRIEYFETLDVDV
jgi:hypothetical protein